MVFFILQKTYSSVPISHFLWIYLSLFSHSYIFYLLNKEWNHLVFDPFIPFKEVACEDMVLRDNKQGKWPSLITL